MPRFFLEVSYKGTHYSGFQVQQNATTIQSELEKAFFILHRKPVTLTGSSRTDAGVHAYQNFFHFDYDNIVEETFVYKMNAILPNDIAVKKLIPVSADAHSRFDAISREYEYHIYQFKNPFLKEVAFYYPYPLDIKLMQEAADCVRMQNNFFAFSKTNTQVKNFNCNILKSNIIVAGNKLIYNIEGNRFLRGMVRLLTGSILKVGTGKLSIANFESLFNTKILKSGLSAPASGLFLKKVNYAEEYFEKKIKD